MDFNTFLERFELDPDNFKPNSAELIKHDRGYIYYCEQETSHIPCPKCHSTSVHIHQYYTRTIRCSMNSLIEDMIIVKRPRFICTECHKTFIKELKGVKYRGKYSNLDDKMMYCDFSKNKTFKEIANTYHLTTTAVIYKFDEMFTDVSRRPLPKFLCIDEFYFSAVADSKYCCVISNFATGEVVDILPSRKKAYLDKYFQRISKKELDNVEVFISDMYKTYRYVRNRYFKRARHVIDKFHFISQLTVATSSLRVFVMNRYYSHNDIHYKFMKKYAKLFTKHKEKLKIFPVKDPETNHYRDSTDVFFECVKKDSVFCEAYDTLQELYKLKEYDTYDEAMEFINYICKRLEDTNNKRLIKVADTYRNWQTGIATAYCNNEYRLNFHNGVAEGNNNLIKTILKNAFGFKNFERFRKRALLILRHTKLR